MCVRTSSGPSNNRTCSLYKGEMSLKKKQITSCCPFAKRHLRRTPESCMYRKLNQHNKELPVPPCTRTPQCPPQHFWSHVATGGRSAVRERRKREPSSGVHLWERTVVCWKRGNSHGKSKERNPWQSHQEQATARLEESPDNEGRKGASEAWHSAAGQRERPSQSQKQPFSGRGSPFWLPSQLPQTPGFPPAVGGVEGVTLAEQFFLLRRLFAH